MSKPCINPVWPCAMTGAASALAGLTDVGVVIHGSSGCYFYADMAVPDSLHSTFLIQDEVIFGAEDRLLEVVDSLSCMYSKIAVINTCVPSVMGEDISGILSDFDVIAIDPAGFSGDFDSGRDYALSKLDIKTDHGREGINIDGICSLDPFHRGNLIEAKRLLDLCKIPVAATFCRDTLESVRNPSPYSVSVNPDYSHQKYHNSDDLNLSILGIDNVTDSFSKISELFPDKDAGKIFEEAEEADEVITKAGSKYLRKSDPPDVMIFGTESYVEFAAEHLKNTFDANIIFAGVRNGEPENTDFPSKKITDMQETKERILNERPDLIIGSSFEYAVSPDIPFVEMTFPIRHKVMLHNRPFAGIEGALSFTESVINSLNKKS
ncbi:oxalate:formate antiporter [Methanoplanus sp. FWC-SCC4]|uniref:Oxalate:formate antiporter n=1 Tax=Methanochimaera problematica TaxID=2609417 RepID=A0AA97FBU6_9EURY|nr:nitrogenase component 1 [Methanoplanus sp. FWC-SCC4]WOF15378.1 oxalate:formate antiporter [Methanoplanus sp. FWC-SCC4]